MAVTPWFFGAENLCITSRSIKVFDTSATTKEEFRSSPVTFLGFSALAATCVDLPRLRRTYFWIFRSLVVRALAQWGILLMKRLPEVAF